MTGLAKNPLLLMLWLGPVVWIGVALYEEVVRVFFLNCLWGISGHRLWIYFSIFLVSLTTGLLHLYQGTFGIVSVTLQGLVLAAYYYKFRRLLPLVVSHALYDSIQIIMFVMQVS
jgi:membrane protease YdiL (CAAX protease family)